MNRPLSLPRISPRISPLTLFIPLLFGGISRLAAQNAPYEFSLATGSNGTTLPIVQTFTAPFQLPQEFSDMSQNEVAGSAFRRSGFYRASSTDGTDQGQGLTLYGEATTSLNLTNVTSPVPSYTFNYQRPYSRTSLKVNRDRIEVTPLPGATSATVRLTASLQSALAGTFPAGRIWRNQGRTFFEIVAVRKRKNNNQTQATQFGNFDVLHAQNNTSTLISNNVVSVFGNGNGAWNSLGGSGSGFIDIVLPENEYLEVTATLFTEVQITEFGGSTGTALSSFESKATGVIKAATTDGAGITSSLGLCKVRQSFLGSPYANQTIASPPLTLNDSLDSGLPLAFEVLSGPGSISGNTLTFDGIRGIVSYRMSHPGNALYAPVERSRTVPVEGLAQTITFPGGTAFPANSVPFDPGAVASSGLPIVYEVLSGPVTASGNLLTPTGGTGNFSVRARQPGNDIYEPATPVDGFFSISPAVNPDTPQTISFPQLITAKAGEGQLVFVTSSSGLPVTLALVEGNGVFTGINRNIFTPRAPGLVRIVATQPGGFFNGVSYQAAAPVERSFTALSSGSAFSDAMILLDLPPGLRGEKDDADGDGVPNLVEYAIGTNPSDSGSGSNPIAATSGTPPSELRLTYPKIRNDVSYSVEGSADLLGWSTEGIDQGTPGAENAVTATAPFSTGYRFLRLSVTTTPVP
ncbi:hypothetical protein HZ994_16005 [Akkermansiaceae bacterium]|nr:hypothetical protein HZ994_16005 [Akkermansiaceae bacterium]